MDLSNLSPFAFISMPGGSELIVIFLVVLLLFGAKKLPELAKGMGKAINEFKKASNDIETEFKQSLDDHPEPKEAEKAEYAHSEAAKSESKS